MKLFTFLAVVYSVPFCAIAASVTVPSTEHSTITSALSRAQPGDTVWVADGTYRGEVMLNPGVVLIARTLHGATLEGKSRGTVVTLAHGATVSGFVIQKGTIGVTSKSANARIQMCRIVGNSQTGVMCVGHLPEIVDNLIAFNKGSGIQGWDLRSTASTITHNTIAYNDNHGVSLGGNSDVIIENSILAFNGQFGVKAETGSVKARLMSSNVYRNGADNTPLANDCISIDPQFTDPHKFDFSLIAGSGCIRAGSDGEDMGARASQNR